MYQVPSRFYGGVTNSGPFPYSLLGNYPNPMPMVSPVDFDDFMGTYTAADWTIQQTGAGTTADTVGNGGLILQTTSGAGNDLQANVRPTAKFTFIAGNQFWFAANFQCSVANLSQVTLGVMDTLVGLAPTDGVYFDKPSGGTVLNLVLRKAGTSTTIPIYSSFAAATSYSVGFYYDGRGTPTLFGFCSANITAPVAYGPRVPFPGGSMIVTAGSDPSNTAVITNLPTVNLKPGFGVKTGAAAAITMTTDYIFAAADAVRF
jgi:hypothetical protein